jgi:hypothetical protein
VIRERVDADLEACSTFAAGRTIELRNLAMEARARQSAAVLCFLAENPAETDAIIRRPLA